MLVEHGGIDPLLTSSSRPPSPSWPTTQSSPRGAATRVGSSRRMFWRSMMLVTLVTIPTIGHVARMTNACIGLCQWSGLRSPVVEVQGSNGRQRL